MRAGPATLLMDQLTEAEEAVDRKSEHLRVDLWLLADGSAQWRAGGDPGGTPGDTIVGPDSTATRARAN